jgi:CII-binding regulator of phage lambda lysogenization HflD
VKSNKIQTQFLLGIINSKLISYYHINTSPNAFKGAFPKVLLQDLRELPMPDMNSRTFQSMHNDMVKLVENMLSLNKEKQQTTLSEKLEQLQHRINHTDEKINKLVYELYKLTEEEIKIIESES